MRRSGKVRENSLQKVRESQGILSGHVSGNPESAREKLAEHSQISVILQFISCYNNWEKFKFVRTSKFLANFSEGKAEFFRKFEPCFSRCPKGTIINDEGHWSLSL